jgi:hypothetical protein
LSGLLCDVAISGSGEPPQQLLRIAAPEGGHEALAELRAGYNQGLKVEQQIGTRLACIVQVTGCNKAHDSLDLRCDQCLVCTLDERWAGARKRGPTP